MPKYLSTKEIEEQFDEKFCNEVTIEKGLYTSVFKEKVTPHEILSHISQIRQNDLKGLQEWAENTKVELTPKEESIKAGWSKEEAELIYARGEMYNQALIDFINHLSSLNQ